MGAKIKKRYRNLPLRARVDRGVLRIEIGIDVLAFATLHGDYVWRLEGQPADFSPAAGSKRFRIDDQREFARDVIREMNDEAEDGSTPLSLFIDQMCEKAIEDGSVAFLDAEDEP